MFKFLRSKAKVFYWVIAFSFILFIFLAWGMNLRSGKPGRRGGDNLVGSVNGHPITAYEWDRALQSQFSRMREQNQEQRLTADQRASATKKVWNDLVRERIVQAEVQRLHLGASDAEILDILKNDPPPELLANYKDENGNPDLAAYLADLTNPNRDWSAVENYLRTVLPRQKLQQMVTAPAVVTELELRDAYQKQYGRAVAEYLGVLFDSIQDDFEPEDPAIETYYAEHPGQFNRPARATVQVVTWTKEPSETDRRDVYNDALAIKEEIESGKLDFAEAASIYSQDGTSEKGGDLGTFDREAMVKPFSEAAFSLPVGQVSDPVLTDFGYHLIEVLERITEGDEVTKVHARHILLLIEPGEETLTDLYTAAEDFLQGVNATNFVAEATADSLDLLSPDPVPEGRDIPGLPNSLEGSQFAFRAAPGSLSPIFENSDCYYLVLVEKIEPEGPASLAEVRSQVVRKLKDLHKHELARGKLRPAVEAVRGGRDMAAVAADLELAHAVTDTFTGSENIPDIGYATPFHAVALEAAVGELVPEVETRRGVFALRVLWREPLDEAVFQAQKERIRSMLLSLKQRELMEAWLAEQVARAEIVDHRDARRGGGA